MHHPSIAPPRALSALSSGVLLTVLLALCLARGAMAQPGEQAVILQYHHVSTRTPPITSISPEDFRTHMDYLRDNGFTVLPLEQVLAALRVGNTDALPDKAAVITFDDAYRNVYDNAYPLLKEYGWPFTIFVPTGLVESNPSLYASWDQLREMADNGATLANHTVSHPYLLERGDDEPEGNWLRRIRDEIEQAESRIEQETGQSHKLLAYPYGEYNPRIQELVRELGYIGIGQQSGPVNASSDFTALPRFPFSGIHVSMNTYPVKVNSLAFDVAWVKPDSPVTDSPSPSAEISFRPGDYRLDQFACYNNSETMRVTAADEARTFRLETPVENRGRRFRYNCTTPGPAGRYYWYTLDWINPAIPE